MSVKTRYGFGSDEIAPPDAAAAPQRNARTVFGHQNHLPNLAIPGNKPSIPPESRATTPGTAARLQTDILVPESPPIAAPQRSPSSAPRKRTPVPSDREQSAERARPRRKSDVPGHKPKRTGPIPAVARFLGRRNTAGDIVPLRENTEIVDLPAREQWVRPVVTVIAAAACSFIIVAIVMWVAGTRKPADPPAETKSRTVSESARIPAASKATRVETPRPILETPPIVLPANISPAARPQVATKPISASRPFVKPLRPNPAKRLRTLPVHDPDAPMAPSLL